MGWLVLNGPIPYGDTRDSYLRREIEQLSPQARARGCKNEVLASSFVGSVWYAAVHVIRPSDAGHSIDCVTALVYLTQGTAQSGFGYKDMDESMGPVETRCPVKILDMLSPVHNLGAGEQGAQWATQWRAACRINAALPRAPRRAS